MSLHSWGFLVNNGILNIDDDDKIIGVFDIEQKMYYKINPADLGEKVTLFLTPYKPVEDDFKPLAMQYPRSIYNYRRLKIYKIQIHTDEGLETSTIKSALSDGSGWFSTIFMTDGTIYQYSYLLGTWRELISWGPYTIEIKEMKKETDSDRLIVSMSRHIGKLYMDQLLDTYNKYILADIDGTVTASRNYNNHINNGGKNEMKTNTIYADWWEPILNSYYGPHAKNKYFPEIKNVVISDPYTTILWSDGSKTQVKCMEGDAFDPEHGFAMAVLKKLMEKPDKPNAYSKWVKQWVKQGIEAGEKQAVRKNKKAEKKAEKETCDSCSWTFDEDGNVQTGPTNIDYSNT